METSALLAKALGTLIAIIALALYGNRKNLAIIYKVAKTREYLLFSGIFNLVVGVLLVLNHNIWVADWRVMVTLLGWVAIVKGVIRLVKPDLVKSSVNYLKKNEMTFNVVFLLTLALGLYLLYVGLTTPYNSFF